jgi:hypothetical protein
MRYLNEEFLGEVLTKIFPSVEFIHDKTVPNSGTRRRPDYRSDELMLIVEFDGDRHYKEVSKIKSEKEKDVVYQSIGYKIVRIPYFIQLNRKVISKLFNVTIEDEIYEYPLGFISNNAPLPCDFSELGVKKFLNDLNRFSEFSEEIKESLRTKISEIKDIDLVLPPSIQELIINQKIK